MTPEMRKNEKISFSVYIFLTVKGYETNKGRCLAWDVSPIAPTPFGFLLLFFVCVVL